MNRKAHAACRKSSGRRRFLASGAFRSEFPFGSGLGQREKSQNSPSEKVLKTQKNPAEIARFQPDLVGVSGFEPEASWSRTKRDTKLRHTPSAWILYVENSDLSRGMHENIFWRIRLPEEVRAMKENRGKNERQAGAGISRLYLLLAMLALVWTLKTCVPAVDAAITKIAGAAQKTKTVQAFSALTERLREGEAVQEALSGSFEILTGAGD